jgi:integrase
MSLKLFKRKPSPNWWIRGTIRGVGIYESTGTAERSAAEAIRIQREKEILDQTIHGRKAVATFIQAAVIYMEAGGERRFLEPLIYHFGTTPLVKIDQFAIDRAGKILYPNASPSTLNRQVYTPMSAILKRAAQRGLCEPRIIERPQQPKGRVRWITIEEADRLIAECADHLQPLVIFLLYTGARLSEALYLDWRQVNLDRQHPQVQFLETKNGESRGVALHQRVIDALTTLPHQKGEVFRRPDGKPYARKVDGGGQIKTAFKAACRRAGIKDFTPHDCRHTWATWFYAINRDLKKLMELGGWGGERMVLRYCHVNVSHLAASIDTLPGGDAAHQPSSKTHQG